MLWMMTLAEIKGMLGINDPIDDVNLTLKMENLQGRFESELSRTLLRGTYTEYFDGGDTSLFLSAFPVESITSVYVDASRVFAASSLLTSDQYALYRLRGQLKYGSGTPWPDGIQNIQVTYIGGYVAAGTNVIDGQYAMDVSLRGAFAMQFEFEWRNKNNLGTNSMSAQGASLNLAPAKFLPEVQRVLDLAKRI
jgi:hypothetical protein